MRVTQPICYSRRFPGLCTPPQTLSFYDCGVTPSLGPAGDFQRPHPWWPFLTSSESQTCPICSVFPDPSMVWLFRKAQGRLRPTVSSHLGCRSGELPQSLCSPSGLLTPWSAPSPAAPVPRLSPGQFGFVGGLPERRGRCCSGVWLSV